MSSQDKGRQHIHSQYLGKNGISDGTMTNRKAQETANLNKPKPYTYSHKPAPPIKSTSGTKNQTKVQSTYFPKHFNPPVQLSQEQKDSLEQKRKLQLKIDQENSISFLLSLAFFGLSTYAWFNDSGIHDIKWYWFFGVTLSFSCLLNWFFVNHFRFFLRSIRSLIILSLFVIGSYFGYLVLNYFLS